MNCDGTRAFLHAYVDGELDVIRSLEIEAHLKECQACAQEQRSLQALHEAVGAGELYHLASASLRKRVRTALHEESKTVAAPHRLLWGFLGLGAVAVLIAVVAWAGFMRGRDATAQGGLIAQEVISGHMRSLMGDHLTDITYSDKHVVKPWFAGRLDFSPVVGDWAAQGYSLVGGRLDYIGGRSVAALVYKLRDHVINLFTWPSRPGEDASVQGSSYQGYNVFHWTQAGMTYWAISDLNEGDLRAFVRLVQAEPAPAPSP
jgi:anti-sigma factor RsiW